MLSDFMITRSFRIAALLSLTAALTIVSAACQKVPLLAPSGSVITLTAGTTALPVNGTAQLIAQLLEPSGTPPHSGTQVIFTTTLGTIEPSSIETDINGRAVATFRAGTANGTATITASSGGASASGTNAVKIAVGTAAVGRVSITASPTLIPATGGTSLISAAAFDINGNPLSSAPVSFSTTSGTLDALVATTDQNGVASTTLRTSSQATVTANIGAQGSTTAPTTPTTGTPTAPTSGQTSASVTVNIAGAPTLLITPPATAPSAGLPVSFTFAVSAAATNGSAIRDLTVDWGDGDRQDLGAVTGNAVVSHVFGSTGTYNVQGTVTDSFGNVVRNAISVTVNPRPQPTVSITTTTTNPTAGTDVTFTASVAPVASTGTVIQNVVVDFGDGTVTNLGPVTGTTITLHHVYQAGGTYTVKLSATDSNGGVGTSVTTVFVQTATPLAVLVSATATPNGLNTTETFTATVLGLGNEVVVNYHWVFGGSNGTADTSSNTVTKSYVAGSGPFTVSVTVTTSSGRQATGTTVITP
jgi:PKD repeat protein